MEHSLWEAWPIDTNTSFVIIGLIISNIVFLYLSLMQTRRNSKLGQDILAKKTLDSSTHSPEQHPHTKTESLEKNKKDVRVENHPTLKIDQTIKMIESGYSIQEINSLLDVEASYLQIIAKHHRRV
jgi:hypothetical protein